MLRRRYLAAIGLTVLSLLLYFALPAGLSLKLKMAVTRIFSPVLHASAAAKQSWDSSRQELQSRTALLEENRQLRQKLALQMQESLRVTELDDENHRLREMVGYRQLVGTRLKPARVIGRDPSNWWKTVLIDAGTNDGVTEDRAVVTPAGLVGKTIAVTKTSARVLLLLDPNCKVSAIIQETRDPGIVEGVFEGIGTRPYCHMEFINRDSDVPRGSTVITSGLGGIFPKGIRIGTVEQTSISESNLYKNARVRPSADLERLEEVFVIVH